MIDAIAEHIWNTGMTQGMGETSEELRAIARNMAEAALALVPKNYQSLPMQELIQNKYFLVAEAAK